MTTRRPGAKTGGVSSAVPPTSTQPDNALVPSRVKADLKPEKFRSLIADKGYPFVWRKAIPCTCFNKDTMQCRPDCTVCDSSGFFYMDPIPIQGIMTSLEKRRDIYRNLGEWLEGSAMVTTVPEHRLGYRDSLAMTTSIMTFSEYLEKNNRRGIRQRLPPKVDAARYRIVRMVHLMYGDTDGAPLELELGVDYVIDKNGWIQWLARGEKLVPAGTTLSALYEFHPVWIVMTNPHGVRDTINHLKTPVPKIVSLPLQSAVKLDYLFNSQVPLPSTEVSIATG